MEDPLLGWRPWRWLGVACLALGGAILGESLVRFARRGLGTPAPWAPPERLVVTGLYRFVRNPMYVGVVALVIGQGLLLGSEAVLVWAACAAAGFHLFVVLYEERALRKRFGAEYEAYCREVRRWLPRLRPFRD